MVQVAGFLHKDAVENDRSLPVSGRREDFLACFVGRQAGSNVGMEGMSINVYARH